MPPGKLKTRMRRYFGRYQPRVGSIKKQKYKSKGIPGRKEKKAKIAGQQLHKQLTKKGKYEAHLQTARSDLARIEKRLETFPDVEKMAQAHQEKRASILSNLKNAETSKTEAEAQIKQLKKDVKQGTAGAKDSLKAARMALQQAKKDIKQYTVEEKAASKLLKTGSIEYQRLDRLKTALELKKKKVQSFLNTKGTKYELKTKKAALKIQALERKLAKRQLKLTDVKKAVESLGNVHNKFIDIETKIPEINGQKQPAGEFLRNNPEYVNRIFSQTPALKTLLKTPDGRFDMNKLHPHFKAEIAAIVMDSSKSPKEKLTSIISVQTKNLYYTETKAANIFTDVLKTDAEKRKANQASLQAQKIRNQAKLQAEAMQQAAQPIMTSISDVNRKLAALRKIEAQSMFDAQSRLAEFERIVSRSMSREAPKVTQIINKPEPIYANIYNVVPDVPKKEAHVLYNNSTQKQGAPVLYDNPKQGATTEVTYDNPNPSKQAIYNNPNLTKVDDIYHNMGMESPYGSVSTKRNPKNALPALPPSSKTNNAPRRLQIVIGTAVDRIQQISKNIKHIRTNIKKINKSKHTKSPSERMNNLINVEQRVDTLRPEVNHIVTSHGSTEI